MLKLWVHLINSVQRDERGAVSAEYGLLLALIAVVLAAAIITLRDEIVGAFNDAAGVF